MKRNEGRHLALYLEKRYSGLSNGEIGSLFGRIRSSGVTKASGRVEEKMKKDAGIRVLVGSIMSKVTA